MLQSILLIALAFVSVVQATKLDSQSFEAPFNELDTSGKICYVVELEL